MFESTSLQVNIDEKIVGYLSFNEENENRHFVSYAYILCQKHLWVNSPSKLRRRRKFFEIISYQYKAYKNHQISFSKFTENSRFFFNFEIFLKFCKYSSFLLRFCWILFRLSLEKKNHLLICWYLTLVMKGGK